MTEKTMLTCRIDKDLADAFKQIAQANNRNQSILIRDWIIDYVKKHKQTEFNFKAQAMLEDDNDVKEAEDDSTPYHEKSMLELLDKLTNDELERLTNMMNIVEIQERIEKNRAETAKTLKETKFYPILTVSVTAGGIIGGIVAALIAKLL